jgi:hypothetical protein
MELLECSREILGYLKTHSRRMKLNAAALTSVTVKMEDFGKALAKTRLNTSSRNDVLEKDCIKKEFVKELRAFMNCYVLYNPLVTDLDREKMGLSLHRGRRPAPVPTSYPVPRLEKTKPREVTMSYRDSETHKRAKPGMVKSVEVRWFIGDEAPELPEEYPSHDIFTTTPIIIPFKEEYRGKTVHFRMRWLNSRNKGGPWSEAIKAIIS